MTGASRTAPKALGGLVALVVLVAASVVLVRLGDGDFSSAYDLTASFDSASAGLHPGSQVLERGVQVGSVSSIVLHHGRAVVTLAIDPQYKLPSGTSAVIEPQNLFGADQVTLHVPDRVPTGAGYLRGGDAIHQTSELDELGQLFATADPLLSKIDTADLANVVDELANAYGGQGKQIAASLDTGTRLAGLFSRTVDQQLAALDAFTRFNVAIEGEGPTLNRIAGDSNETLPLFNAAEAAYAHLLSTLSTFSDQFAVLLRDYRPKINVILDDGDNVLRVLLAQKSDLASAVQGLAQYVVRFSKGASSATLPDGTKFGYFKTFVLWSDVEHVVCSLIAPPKSGLSFLEPLQSAVAGGGSPLDCSSELAAFRAAQAQGGSQSVTTTPPTTSTPAGGSSTGVVPGQPAGLPAGLGKTAGQLVNGLYGALGAPEQGGSTGIGSYIDSLLLSP